jgi:hypothetical protein
MRSPLRRVTLVLVWLSDAREMALALTAAALLNHFG